MDSLSGIEPSSNCALAPDAFVAVAVAIAIAGVGVVVVQIELSA